MNGRRVLVGITGGIAAYKTAQLVSLLAQAGADVQVVMTAAAAEFVSPSTLAALAGRAGSTNRLGPQEHPLAAHIYLARHGELLIVAPCTANFLAKAAQGVANDLLSTLYLCFRGPVLLAPAMNAAMWEHPAVQRNVSQVRADGAELIGPGSGWLSCRDEG